MRKILKRSVLGVLCLAVAFGVVRFAPNIYERLFGNGNTQWISERFSETLLEKNELVVYEIETTGQETVSQDAWLIGTVQKVEIPYTFQMSFTVDLSVAKVSAVGNTVEVRVPKPKPGYQKLTVDEAKMKKTDWLYPLTPERYSAIKEKVEAELFNEYAASEECAQNAWGVTVKNLEGLFHSLLDHSQDRSAYEIRVIQDDTLGVEAPASPETTPANAA